MIDIDKLPSMACGRCLAFVENEKTNGNGGECHLNPPSVVVVRSTIQTASGSQDHINTVFCPVPVASWCLRFVDKASYLEGLKAGSNKVTPS